MAGGALDPLGDVPNLAAHPSLLFLPHPNVYSKVLLARGINVRGYMIRARSARLRHVSTVIEYQLYKVAATYDQYSDLITLEERMAGVVTAYFLHQRQRRGGGADGGSAAAVAPPLGVM